MKTTLPIVLTIASLFLDVPAYASSHQTVDLVATLTTAKPGDTIGYTVSYANWADSAIEYVTLTLDYDERYLQVVEPNGAMLAAGVLIYRQPRLLSGKPESRTFWFKVKDDLKAGGYTASASAKLAGKEMTNVYSQTATTRITAQAKLFTSLNVDLGEAGPGDILTYSILFRNDGDAPAENAVLTFDFDETVTEVVSVSDKTAPAQGKIVWPAGIFYPGQKSNRTVSISVRENATVKQFDTSVKITAANASPAEQHILTPVLGANAPLVRTTAIVPPLDRDAAGVVKGAATVRAPRTGGAALPVTFGISALMGTVTFLMFRRRLA